jgi:hypothetical protein
VALWTLGRIVKSAPTRQAPVATMQPAANLRQKFRFIGLPWLGQASIETKGWLLDRPVFALSRIGGRRAKPEKNVANTALRFVGNAWNASFQAARRTQCPSSLGNRRDAVFLRCSQSSPSPLTLYGSAATIQLRMWRLSGSKLSGKRLHMGPRIVSHFVDSEP